MEQFGICIPVAPPRWNTPGDAIHENVATVAASSPQVISEAPRPSRMTAAHRQRSYFTAIGNGSVNLVAPPDVQNLDDAQDEQDEQQQQQNSSPVRLKKRQSHLWALEPPRTTVRTVPFGDDCGLMDLHNVSMSLPLSTTTDHTYVGVVEEILTELTEHDPCRGIFANTLMMLTGNESWA